MSSLILFFFEYVRNKGKTMQKTVLREATRPPHSLRHFQPSASFLSPPGVTNPTGGRSLFLTFLCCKNKRIHAYFLIFLLSYVKRCKYPKNSFVFTFWLFLSLTFLFKSMWLRHHSLSAHAFLPVVEPFLLHIYVSYV